MNKTIALFNLVIILFGCQVKEDPNSKNALNPIVYSMDNNANLILENSEINSISIGVYKDGKTYEKYYGEIDKGKENPPTENSLFEIASVTKTFTGILTAHAVLEGKLKLEDDIRKYLNGSYNNLELKKRPIEVRDLLTHTSGITRDFSKVLANMFSLTANEFEKKAIIEYNRESLLEDLVKFKLNTIPGNKYDYSPIVGPEILATMLEKVYDKSYSELLNEFVLKEADMKNTTMHINAGNEKKMVNSYTDVGQLIKPLPILMTGAGYGLKSTIPDLVKYIQFLLESKNPAIEEMKRSIFFDEEEGDRYGYFWQLGDDDFMHNGGTNGSTLWVILLPEHNSGFTVVFNSNGKKSGSLVNRIANWIYNDIENYPKMNAYFPIRKAILAHTENGIQYYEQLKKDSLGNFDFADESMLNRIGYELLRNDKISEAIKVFKLLVSEFPNLANPYDSLGEGYLMNEQYDLALVNYRKSFELNPKSEHAVEMIERIEYIQSNQ